MAAPALSTVAEGERRTAALDPGSLPWRKAAGVIAVFVLVALLAYAPAVLNSYRLFVLALIVIYSVGVLGLNVLVGWSGQIGLAHAGFFALGAYGTSLLTNFGIPFLLSLLITGILAAAAGVVVGWPAVQLHGFFLAIATLALGELLVRGFAEARALTGGGRGFSVPTFRVFNANQTTSAYYLSVITAVIAFMILYRLLTGRFGRTLKAVRDMEIATGPVGIPAARYKLMAFSLSGFVGAIAGAMFAQLHTFIFPDMFTINLLVVLLVMLLVGGVASITGSIIGATFGVFIVEQLQDLGEYQRLVYGLALVVVVRFLPGGMASIPSRLRQTRAFSRFQRPSREIGTTNSARQLVSDIDALGTGSP